MPTTNNLTAPIGVPLGSNIINFAEAAEQRRKARLTASSSAAQRVVELCPEYWRAGLPTEENPDCPEWLRKRYEQKRFAFRLRVIRKVILNITVEEAAGACGVKAQQYGHYEQLGSMLTKRLYNLVGKYDALRGLLLGWLVADASNAAKAEELATIFPHHRAAVFAEVGRPG